MSRRPHVVVIGGGASGVLAAAALLDTGAEGLETAPRPFVTMIEPNEDLGLGLAYGRADEHHLLNSPAGRMGALARDPGGFVRWSVQDGGPALGADEFAPRRRYGRYLQDVARRLRDEHVGSLATVRARATLVRTQGTGVVVSLDTSWDLVADHVVLALGNPPTAGTALDGVAARDRVPDPWAPGALDAVAPGDRVTLVGTGLTAVDVATSLVRRHPTVQVTMVSRNGLLPETHPRTPAGTGDGIVPTGPGVAGILAGFSRSWHAARLDGTPWQRVVDGIRPQVNDLWASLDDAERRRFVARYSRRWEVLRHRMSPPVADALDALVDRGVVTVRAGRAADVPTDVVVDCTGPRPFASRGWSRLVDAMLDYGVVRPDALGIGLAVDDDGALLDDRGEASPRLWALGPARRGSQWESTAVPEIRSHASRIAARVRLAAADRSLETLRAERGRRPLATVVVPGVAPSRAAVPAGVATSPEPVPQVRGLD